MAFASGGDMSAEEYAMLDPTQKRELMAMAMDEARRASPAMLPGGFIKDPPIDAWETSAAYRPATAESMRMASAPASIRGYYDPKRDAPGMVTVGGLRIGPPQSVGRGSTGPGNMSHSATGTSGNRSGSQVSNQQESRTLRERYCRLAESVNGRAAALGFVLCLAREALEPAHPSLLDQVSDVLVPIVQHAPPFVISLVDLLSDIVL
jgi:hypothetical protein